MGNRAPKPMILSEHTVQIKCSYVSHANQVHIDRDVAALEYDERALLKKYGPDNRTLDNMLFKDELMMGAVLVRKITAIKKTLIYVKFLENAKKFVSDSRQNFDRLPESSKTSVKNIVFAAAHLPDKDIHDFAMVMKRYYRESEEVQTAHKSESIDPELRKECLIVKNQAIPDAQLIDYYIEFMRRHNLEPICGNFGKQVQQQQQQGANNFGGPGPNGFASGGGNGFGGPNGGQTQQWGQPQQGQYQQGGFQNQQQPMQQQGQPQQFPGIAGLQQSQGQQPPAYQPNANNPFGNPSQPPQGYNAPAPAQGGFQQQQAPTYGNAYPVSGGGYTQGPNPFDNTQNYNAYAQAQNPGQAPAPNTSDDFMSQLEGLKLGK